MSRSSVAPAAQRDPLETPYYFGKLDRTLAERWLSGSTVRRGCFLVRRSTSEPENYTLTLRCDGEVVHYQIHNHGECWYSIDNGPMFLGLNDMVEHYTAVSDGLPTTLKEPYAKTCNMEKVTDPGKGNTMLHTACLSGDLGRIRSLATRESLPKLNYWGRTAMHEAVRGDAVAAIVKLLEVPAAEDLLTTPDTRGWLPIHYAAYQGNAEITKLLMKSTMTIHQKTGDDELPRNLAARMGHVQCSIFLGLTALGMGDPTQLQLRSFPWYHGRLTRASAEFVLQRHGNSDGLFLVRQSGSGSQRDCVLSMGHGGLHYHYQIKADSMTLKYNIDDGPPFAGLDALVAYYSNKPDGLAQVLRSFCLIGKETPLVGGESNTSMTSNAYQIIANNGQGGPSGGAGADSPGSSALNIIPEQEITHGRKIGSGNFGDVKAGVWHKPGMPPVDVALKTLKDLEQQQSATQEFLKEAADMTSLNHAYVVSILGICMGGGLSIVLELIPYGALETFLRKENKNRGAHDRWVKDGYPYLFARQVVEGMDFLEQKRVCHRDLATRNILLKEHTHIKISDFGLSRTLRPEENYYTSTTGGKWPIKWYAPESVNYGKFTAKSDVFSFGVTLWEIYTAAQEPWGDMMMADVLERLNDGKRLEQPARCPKPAYDIMLKCWAMESVDRPTFKQLMSIFDPMVPSSMQKHVL
jgi:tyrosine-protein kinase